LVICSKQVLNPLPPDVEFERGRDFLENKKYNKAIESFERIVFYYASSEYVDDAQYWLGRSSFEKKDYTQAIIEFEYLIKNFPNSQFLEQAYLYRAKAYFLKSPGYDKDQSETGKATKFLDQFLTQFPNSEYTDEVKNLILQARERLAKKEFENGRLYLRLNEPDAALLYFQYLITNYPETKFSLEAKYYAASIYEKKGELDQALRLYKELIGEQGWKIKAEKKIKKIEKREG